MSDTKVITISHFSDVLCIWAYIAQIRIDELKTAFGADIDLQYHFCPVFGSVETMLEKNWNEKGGVAAFNKHIQKVASKFEHIDVHPEIWLESRPTTSISCHLYCKALQLVEKDNAITEYRQVDSSKTAVENYMWQARLAFFRDARDISDFDVLDNIAGELDLPVIEIQKNIQSGAALAAMDSDEQLKNKYNVAGSPTLVLNEGRQIIYGNVGYRVIEANVRELLHQPEHQASWC